MSAKSYATSPRSRGPPGDDADADESNEQAYAELVEFIRVAAQVVFEELLPLRRQVYPTAPAAAALSPDLMDRKEFARRRRQFMRMIGKDAIAVLPGRARCAIATATSSTPTGRTAIFTISADFPSPKPWRCWCRDAPQAEYLLFVREHDALRESWDGAWAGTDGAVERYGADDAFPIADIDEILPGLMEQRSRIFYSMGAHLGFRSAHAGMGERVRVQARQGAGAPQEFVALSHVLDDMRLYKSRAEQASLRRAAQIAMGAHRRAMRFARPGRMEYEVMAELLHEFRSHNADMSYHPIVGSGANACIMHYRANDQRLCDGRPAVARCGLRA